ncbi:MAG: hypothetical protein WKF75_13260 [Singulisphaera sp.]
MRRARARSVVLLGAACLVTGCGEGKPSATSSTREATVQGTVTVLGKPATKGQVTFDPRNINRPQAVIRTAEIGKDGAYRVTTLVGPNTISINVPRPPRPMPGMSPELGLDVKPGENTRDIALPVTGD